MRPILNRSDCGETDSASRYGLAARAANQLSAFVLWNSSEMFADLKRLIDGSPHESRLGKLLETERLAVRSRFPGVPDDYTAFLSEVGHGLLLDGCLVLFDSPVEVGGYFDTASAEELRDVRLIGFTASGVYFGFCLPAWELVEIDPTSLELYADQGSFEEFIRTVVKRVTQRPDV